jgi:endonuclease/exonuclease/phosphatase family metal-dependent hydrolase
MAFIFRKFTKGFIVLSNIVVSIIFLLGSYASWFNPTYFWFVGFFTLASFYLFLVLIGFIFFWAFAKKKLMLISICTILLAWRPLGQIVKFRLESKFEPTKAAKSIRVMSWNVEQFKILQHKTHPEEKQKMLDLINENAPDIACFQEMVGADRGDTTAINYVPTISKKIGFQHYFYSYHEMENYDSKHHFGIITYSKYPIINKKTVFLESYYYNSTFQYIDIKKSEDTFRVYNLHLQSLRFTPDNLKYINDAQSTTEIDLQKSKSVLSKLKVGFLKRKLQCEGIKKSIDESPYPVIVCGDFNDVPNSYAYCTIGKNLKNTFAEKGSGIGRTFSGISPTLRIDNIFVDEHFEVDQYTRVTKKLSDHFPIIADITFEKE